MGQIAQLLDSHFAYRTPKYVEVHDWRLGLLHKALQLIGLGYVFLWTMFYKCRHLRDIPVSGYARVDISTPTRDGCFEADSRCKLDLRSFAELPYCLQGKAEPTNLQKTCIYRDAYDLSPSTPTPNALFVPFYVNRMFQRQGCKPADENGWHCDQLFITQADEDGGWQHGAFIADVERYRLLISHSYEAGSGSDPVSMGRSQTSKGALGPSASLGSGRASSSRARGRIRHALPGVEHAEVQIPDSEGGNPDFRTLSHSPWGDEMSIADLLKLADPRGADAVLAMTGENGLQRRERGGVLAVSIEYTNADSFDIFGLGEPRYTLSARLLPMQWFYQSHSLPHERSGRHVEAYQGLMVTVDVHGSFREFDWYCLLQVLTTSMVLLTLAGVLTDALMSHCTQLATQYQLLRRQPGSATGDLRDALGRVREMSSVQALPGQDCGLGPHEDLLATLERIERRLDGVDTSDGHFTRDSSSDMAGARLEGIARDLMGSGSVRVAPL